MRHSWDYITQKTITSRAPACKHLGLSILLTVLRAARFILVLFPLLQQSRRNLMARHFKLSASPAAERKLNGKQSGHNKHTEKTAPATINQRRGKRPLKIVHSLVEPGSGANSAAVRITERALLSVNTTNSDPCDSQLVLARAEW